MSKEPIAKYQQISVISFFVWAQHDSGQDSGDAHVDLRQEEGWEDFSKLFLLQEVGRHQMLERIVDLAA